MLVDPKPKRKPAPQPQPQPQPPAAVTTGGFAKVPQPSTGSMLSVRTDVAFNQHDVYVLGKLKEFGAQSNSKMRRAHLKFARIAARRGLLKIGSVK
jgi:hypothetical protein